MPIRAFSPFVYRDILQMDTCEAISPLAQCVGMRMIVGYALEHERQKNMPDSPSEILADLIREENILVDLPSEEHSAVIKAMVQNMVSTELVAKSNTSTVSRLLNEREALGSTAIGGGVAIPHARIGFSEEPLMAFALLKDGLGFNSLDGASVHFVFMVLTPKDDDEIHRDVLKAITFFAKKPIHLKALSGCKTPADVKSVFQDYA